MGWEPRIWLVFLFQMLVMHHSLWQAAVAAELRASAAILRVAGACPIANLFEIIWQFSVISVYFCIFHQIRHPSCSFIHPIFHCPAFHAFEVRKLHWLSWGRILPWCISLRANFKALVKCWNVNWAKRGRFHSLHWVLVADCKESQGNSIIQLFFRQVVCTTCMLHEKMICNICMFWSSFVDVYVSNIFKLFHQWHTIYIYTYIYIYMFIDIIDIINSLFFACLLTVVQGHGSDSKESWSLDHWSKDTWRTSLSRVGKFLLKITCKFLKCWRGMVQLGDFNHLNPKSAFLRVKLWWLFQGLHVVSPTSDCHVFLVFFFGAWCQVDVTLWNLKLCAFLDGKGGSVGGTQSG